MMKLILIACEFIGIFFLIGSLRSLHLPVQSIILYAWNPLIIKVFAGSAHMDAILVACVGGLVFFAINKRPFLIIIAFAAAVLAKLSPIILFPFLMRRVKWYYLAIGISLILLAYLPFIDAGKNLFEGFLTFSRTWQFNAGIFAFVQWIVSFVSDHPSDIARAISSLMLGATILILMIKDDRSNNFFITACTLSFGVLFIAGPTVMPWYISWVLPFALLSRQYAWFILSGLLLIAFHIMIDQVEYTWPLWIEFGLFFIALLWSKRRLLNQIREQI